jgi:hypothetical protein
MTPLFLASLALFALLLMILIEIFHLRAQSGRRRRVRLRHPRRQPLLEDRIRTAFDGPRAAYGEIFVSYMVWRREHETRLELFTGDPWAQLNEFTRCLIVRHLWRALEKLTKGAVVVVDSPPQQWSKDVDATFDDRGENPWAEIPHFGTLAGGPQFIKDR